MRSIFLVHILKVVACMCLQFELHCLKEQELQITFSLVIHVKMTTGRASRYITVVYYHHCL